MVQIIIVAFQFDTLHSFPPIYTLPQFAPKAVPLMVSSSPPRGVEDVVDKDVTVGVKSESYSKDPPLIVVVPKVTLISDAALFLLPPVD